MCTVWTLYGDRILVSKNLGLSSSVPTRGTSGVWVNVFLFCRSEGAAPESIALSIGLHHESSCCCCSSLSVLLRASQARLLVRSSGEYLTIIASLTLLSFAFELFYAIDMWSLTFSVLKVIRPEQCSVIIKAFKWHATSLRNNVLKSS